MQVEQCNPCSNALLPLASQLLQAYFDFEWISERAGIEAVIGVRRDSKRLLPFHKSVSGDGTHQHVPAVPAGPVQASS